MKKYLLVFAGTCGNLDLAINMNGTKWIVTSDKSWCTISVNSSQTAYAQITVTATEKSPTRQVWANHDMKKIRKTLKT